MSDLLRPERLNQIIGQPDLISNLKILIDSANKRKDILESILLHSPAGCGKTTIAIAIANELDAQIQLANASNISNSKKLLPYLMRITEGSVFFIDEIHSLNKKVCENLYTVIESYRVEIASEKDSVNLTIPKFTFIGASTEIGRLPKPFIDRFKFNEYIKPYKEEDLVKMILINARKLNIAIDKMSAKIIAQVSRHTPRIANRILEWCRDVALSKNTTSITPQIVNHSLHIKEIDEEGLTLQDKCYLKFLEFYGGTASLQTLVSGSGIAKETIVNLIEPWLLSKGKIKITNKGRYLL